MPYPTLSTEQASAVADMSSFLDSPYNPSKPYYTVHGLAGSGKTTTLAELGRSRQRANLCTLTGKAADVLRRKTGLPTSTIHSVFYKLKKERVDGEGRSHLEWQPTFGADELSGQVILLDECSMINQAMAADIIATGCKIIACGDPGQLPPVQGQQFFTTPDFTLKTIHRQALESAIIRQAHWVRLGKGYADDGPDFRVLPRATREEVLSADIILCWKNTTRHAVNALVREYRGLNAAHPVAGEQVMCLKNAKDYGIYNGAIYTLLKDFVDGDDSIVVDVDGDEVLIPDVNFEGMRKCVDYGREVKTSFAFAQCITVHKSQGSEFDKVLVIDEYWGDDYVPWIYTAITRAAKQCVVVRK